jgi:hypothetical protein
MAETKIPGIAILKNTVSKNCRKRPQEEWINQVIDGMRKQLIDLDKTWEKDSDVKFHAVLTVEYERD